MESIIFIKIKDKRIPLKDIKNYYSINRQREASNKNVYSICIETFKENLIIDFLIEKDRDNILNNLNSIINIQHI